MTGPQPRPLVSGLPAGADMPVATLQVACRRMADWLEGRQFRATISDPDIAPEQAKVYVQMWILGFRRAIHELRAAAEVAPIVPDDASEIDDLPTV